MSLQQEHNALIYLNVVLSVSFLVTHSLSFNSQYFRTAWVSRYKPLDFNAAGDYRVATVQTGILMRAKQQSGGQQHHFTDT